MMRPGISGFAHDRSLRGNQRRIQGNGPVTVLFESVPLSSSWRKSQHRIKPVERLDGGRIIDTEVRGVRCRV